LREVDLDLALLVNLKAFAAVWLENKAHNEMVSEVA
jgi:hypothetical protein